MSGGKRILVLDDEVLVGLALADELEMGGFHVLGPFANSRDAFASLDIEVPDGAFLDVNLGNGKTSHELAATLMDKGVSVVFLTGYSEVVSNDPRLRGARRL